MSVSEKLITVAEKLKDIFDAGKQKQRAIDWDAIMPNKDLATQHVFKFAGRGWNDTTFYPPYNIILKWSNAGIFSFNGVKNLKQRLEECGVILDTSQATSLQQAFYASMTSHIPEISFMGVPNNFSVWNFCSLCENLVSIDKIITHEGVEYNAIAENCTRLEHIIFEGVIGRNISFLHSPLSMESCKSIITALKDYSGTSKEFVYSVTFKDTVKQMLQNDYTAPGGISWYEYAQSKKWNL